MDVAKPVEVHAREREWAALVRFATDSRPGPTLGVVYGRRRQGKTYLLHALTGRLGGLLHVAVQDVATRALGDLAVSVTGYLASPAPVAFGDWSTALDTLLKLGRAAPTLVVLDEFPYLVAASPELPSVLQRALGPASTGAGGSRTRLVVCGSAMSVMSKLLTGTAPLRGRAGLDLVVHPFDLRDTAALWGIEDPEVAVLLHAVVGGTPAYRDLLRGDAPATRTDFDDWVRRAVLDPASPLAREGAYLLAEEPTISDRALYHAILSAIAEGRTRRGQIAAAIGRRDNELGHPLSVLTDLRLVRASADPLRARRTTFAVAEPIVRFHHSVVRTQASRLERGLIGEAWQAAAPTFSSQVLGPHFEELAREWTARGAGGVLDEVPDQVGATVIGDPGERRQHEVDVLALAAAERGRRRVLVLGEAKWRTAPLDLDEVERLERVRSVLAARSDLDLRGVRLTLFSRSGFSPRVRSRKDLVLVDPAALVGRP